MTRTQLTDEAWGFIAPYLSIGRYGPYPERLRQQFEGVEALLDGLIAEAAKWGEVDLSLVSVDSTIARAHHDAAGMQLGDGFLATLERAAEEKARSKGGDEQG